MIGSDGGHFTKMPHPRLWGTFTRVLGHYVRTRRLLTLEQAVHKMTGLPAAVFALPDRGRIARGMAADITVLDPQRVQSMATFDVPQQPSAGIEAVVVNGQLAWFDGRVQQRAGRLLPPGQR
ncbi:MAG TPA: amidohydrolase family protein, partial [Rubrivivax sp.]|nr:amidohydrolase family protein [Rubrivivax sp.]